MENIKKKKPLPPCIYAREGTVLLTSFKIIVTEVGQITQTVTNLYRPAFAHLNEISKTPLSNSFYVLRQQGNLLHF